MVIKISETQIFTEIKISIFEKVMNFLKNRIKKWVHPNFFWYRIVHVKTDKNCDFSTWPSPILILFCTFAGIKKQKISAYHIFRKYRFKIIYGTNFSSFLDFRVIHSITAQSIFEVEPSAWARWKGILIENITKIKQEKQQQHFFLLRVTENGITQKANFLYSPNLVNW
jgi:hypothetical protein